MIKNFFQKLRKSSDNAANHSGSDIAKPAKLRKSRLINNKQLVVCTILLSIIAWLYSYTNNMVLLYNDSMSHLNRARLVIDNVNPGLSQIGTVWLPLGHILKLPLIWNEWAWRSGFAGSAPSMIAYILSVIGIYKIIFELTKNRLAGLVGALTVALNINFLYLQTTPLTESIYVALFVFTTLYLLRYLKTSNNAYLLLVTLLTALQLMTRYEGWFVAGVIFLILAMHEFRERRLPRQQAIGQLLLYIVPLAFTCILWLGWNSLIFGDPLYFANGPMSARAQQEVINDQSGLVTKGNIVQSLSTFGLGVAANVGWLVINIALLGWALYLQPRLKKHAELRLAMIITLFSVIAFNVLALFIGFSTISIPGFNWDGLYNPTEHLFNVRYGIVALPFAAVGVGLVANKWRLAVPIAICVIIAQSLITLSDKPVTVLDGQIGASAFVQDDMSARMKASIQNNEDVLTSMAYFMPITFASDRPLRNFVHEGAGEQWQMALESPQKDIEWILMATNDDQDPIYKELVIEQDSEFLNYYQLVHQSDGGRLFKLSNDMAQK